MKLGYITAMAPLGREETFVLCEMIALTELGVDLVIAPRSPSKELFHQEGKDLLARTVCQPLLSWPILASLLRALIGKPRTLGLMRTLVRSSRSASILGKNLGVLPKAVWLADLLDRSGVEHIHAHWGSTTSTMAWVISDLTGIPWSFTLHRWDIAEDNMVLLKVQHAAFARCISEDGRNEVLSIVGAGYRDKVRVVHMGVRLPRTPPVDHRMPRSTFVIACVASLVPKKGHRILLEACALLSQRGVKGLQCLIIGDGPCEKEIRRQITQTGLEGVVQLVGRLPHGDVMDMYQRGEVDLVVLPSLVAADGQKEGIPVALMEAMAYGIPVVSTTTGGIPELLHGGAGILVPPASPPDLADAVQRLINDRDLRVAVGAQGRARVREQFDVVVQAQTLVRMIQAPECTCAALRGVKGQV